jgi:hypothetical protein
VWSTIRLATVARNSRRAARARGRDRMTSVT